MEEPAKVSVDVEEFLNSNNLGQLVETVGRHGICDMETLLTMERADMKEIGMAVPAMIQLSAAIGKKKNTRLSARSEPVQSQLGASQVPMSGWAGLLVGLLIALLLMLFIPKEAKQSESTGLVSIQELQRLLKAREDPPAVQGQHEIELESRKTRGMLEDAWEKAASVEITRQAQEAQWLQTEAALRREVADLRESLAGAGRKFDECTIREASCVASESKLKMRVAELEESLQNATLEAEEEAKDQLETQPGLIASWASQAARLGAEVPTLIWSIVPTSSGELKHLLLVATGGLVVVLVLGTLLARWVVKCCQGCGLIQVESVVRSGSLTWLTTLYFFGLDLSASDQKEGPLVHMALKRRHLGVAKFLISKGATFSSDGSEPALHLAVQYDDLELVQLLTSKGAALDPRDQGGATPLLSAILGDHLDMAKFLISTGASIKDLDGKQTNVLHAAAARGHLELVRAVVLQELVKTDLDLKETDGHRRTALHWAAKSKNLELVKFLVSQAPELKAAGLNREDEHGTTPLHFAAERGCHEMVGYLLDQGANINAPDKTGATALHIVAKNEEGLNEKDVIWTIAALYETREGKDQVKLDAKDSNGRTPLHLAVYHNCQPAVESCLSHGCDLRAIDNDRTTPLHIAAQRGLSHLFNKLLAFGAETRAKGLDLAAKDKNGRRPLDLAASEGHQSFFTDEAYEACKDDYPNGSAGFLLAAEHGCLEVVQDCLAEDSSWLEAVDGSGRLAIMLAAIHGHHKVVEFLWGEAVKRLGLEREVTWAQAFEDENLHAVAFLLSRDGNIDVETGKTPLDLAAKKGHVALVEFFASVPGVSLEGHPRVDKTPLHRAVQYGHSAVVKNLIDKKAKLDVWSNGWTPLTMACNKGNEEIARLLVEARCDINAKMSSGTTVLNYAKQHGNCPSLVRYLESQGATM